MLDLRSDIQHVPGVGPYRADHFRALGILTLADLVKHLPHRHEFDHGEVDVADLEIDAVAAVRGEVTDTRFVRGGRGRGPRFEVRLADDTGYLDLVWFHAGYLRQRIHPGHRLRVQGKVRTYKGHPQMVNPRWEMLAAEDDGVVDGTTPPGGDGDDEADRPERAGARYRPVYPASGDLRSPHIDEVVQGVLDVALPLIEDHLPEGWREERGMPSLAEAYRLMHRPADADDVAAARRRLAYDELLLLQTGVAMRRHELRERAESPALPWNESIDEHIRARFPFTLTDDQDAVIAEIRDDVRGSVPMNRLLQGDVGAGKTVVALYAMLLAVADRRQAALLAPTEILAEQHLLSMQTMLEGSNVRMDLLTGGRSAAERESVARAAAAGDLDLVIGTHALLGRSVEFERLAVLVIDEQHRFGVQQRATIRARALETGLVPHTLIMTATPIPRTLSMTLFGDLDVSTLRGRPPGRRPVTTRVVNPPRRTDVYDYAAERVRAGEQCYVVVPAVDETAGGGLSDVRSTLDELRAGPFAGLECAGIHGRLKRETRARIMDRFRRGKVDVIVATTVIEVGVDVPNASIMIVEHAERFGLSQLHQLRGRVGRGERQSLCVFIGDPTTEDSKRRLDALAETDDGFRIAEADLEIRGMGEILGTRQAGLAPFRVAEIPRDLDLLRLARRDARSIIESDPHLERAEHDLLRRRMMKQFGEGLGIGDVG